MNKLSRSDPNAYDASPSCIANIKYRQGHDPDIPKKDRDGRSIREHEHHHVTISEQYATKLDDAVTAHLGCVCKPCFDARFDYLVKLEDYYRTYARYDNAKFDCDVYLSPIKPGNPRDQRCKKADEYMTQLIAKYPDLQKAESERIKACGK